LTEIKNIKKIDQINCTGESMIASTYYESILEKVTSLFIKISFVLYYNIVLIIF